VDGGRTRTLLGGADRYVKGRIADYRDVATRLLEAAPPFTITTLLAEQRRLASRLEHFGDCRDAPEIWRRMKLSDATAIPDLSDESFLAIPSPMEAVHDAR
jgi:malonate decarboxylase beta subunit